MNEGFLQVGDLRIHHLTGGTGGADIVFLHGGGTNSASLCWGPCLASIARDHRVWAPDLPGFGSSQPLSRCTLDALVDFLDEYLDALGLTHPVVVAHSMAGLVALQWAGRRPEAPAGLILIDALGLGSRVPYRPLVWLARRWSRFQPAVLALSRRIPALLQLGLRANLVRPEARRDPELVAGLRREMQRERAGQAWREFLIDQARGGRFKGDDPDRLTTLKAPVLIVHGDRDKLVAIKAARQSVRQIPNGRLVELGNCGHWPTREMPDEVSEQIREFVNSC